MPTASPLKLADPQELAHQTVRDVFLTMLGTEAWPNPEDDGESRLAVCGALFLVGQWQGAVLVELDESLAFFITAHLEDAQRPVAVDSYVRDAVGEVANMLAGNLKALLPDGALLSVPSVVAGADYSFEIVGAGSSSRSSFSTPHGRLRLTLVEMTR